MRETMRRLGAMALVLAAAAGPAGAGDVLEHSGLVIAKNVARSTVTVGDRVLQADAGTLIEDIEGRRIGLDQVPVAGDPPQTMGQDEPGAVHYEAEHTPLGWQLRHLQLLEAVPK